MTEWLCGTSGYAYKEWQGSFYPEKIKAADMLAYYAERLPAVEINNTFYRMPRDNVLQNWHAATPDGFQFVIKASRRITHQAKLADAADSVDYLCERVRHLGDKLACVLFQLPPYLKYNHELLHGFCATLPADLPFAFEFRSTSWFCDDTFETLAAGNHTICITDDEKPGLPERLTTSAMAYVRLRHMRYDDESLQVWIDRLRAADPERALLFFKHEDEGAGPVLARRFLDRVR